MSSRVINMMQTLFDGEFALTKIPITIIKESHITADDFSNFEHARPIGISPGYSSSSGKLAAIAIADDKRCLIIEFKNAPPKRGKGNTKGNANEPSRNQGGLQLLQTAVLCRDAGELIAFDMGPLAMSLYTDARLRVTNAVDIQSGVSAVDRKPLTAIKAILGDAVPIKETNVVGIFRYPEYEGGDRNNSTTELAMRAWVSQVLATYGNGAEVLAKVKRINTLELNEQILNMIAKIANDSLRLEHLKPTQTKHHFSSVRSLPGESTTADATAYKDKFRVNRHFKAVVQGPGNSEYIVRGQVDGVIGKSGYLDTDRSLQNKTIKSIVSIGRDDPTTAEAHRSATILRILQGSRELLSDSPWVKNIWFPLEDGSLDWPLKWSDTPSPQLSSSSPLVLHYKLNPSQQVAVNTMCSLSDSHRIAIVQGPPGTGKTSVIATFIQVAIYMGWDGIWLVAQSNVAVKNIAEKLLGVGFMDWKLLVSRDFHFDWHEHLYTKIQDKVIRSERFLKYPDSQLQGCKVFLCTLSMLSSNNISKFIRCNPLKTLVVDEASQIEIGNYIPVFSRFESTLRKACFIGDDKQLPPFGQEDLQDLQSIFEISHLRDCATFLDTQYRMPPQIGDIISDAVYDAKLKSNPLHPITNKIIACHFIDIPSQEKRHGDSYMNSSECTAVLKLAEHLQDQEKAYQIITPYEGQRGTIEEEMRTNGLNWENKCFNVDSFQGNEEDYIIISLVRSWELGFLDNLRRTNVMLTRCKKGMFIFSSKKFLTGKASSTLVGTLMEKMGPEAWLDMKDVEDGNF